MRSRFSAKLEIIVKGHLLNPFWLSHMERRRRRGEVTAIAVGDYLQRYAPAVASVPVDSPVETAQNERIFSIWLQGEDQAPQIVQACWRSIRANCSEELVVLDGKTLFEWIQLPEFIVDKWRSGKMRAAHFTDICRVELLYRYGGVWMDSTDFVSNPLPQWLLDLDFFVFMSGDRQRGFYSYIQNCFIRARKGSYLLKCWREAMFAYWEHEDSTVDYFVHQLLFKKVLECNPLASRQFAAMPKYSQDATHTVWFGGADRSFDPDAFASMTSAALFQKTEYKSRNATDPVPGSYADAMMKMYR